jgi:hypothetical protein
MNLATSDSSGVFVIIVLKSRERPLSIKSLIKGASN